MPLFADAMERLKRNTAKKIKETELRYRMVEKEGGTITPELQESLRFYREL